MKDLVVVVEKKQDRIKARRLGCAILVACSCIGFVIGYMMGYVDGAEHVMKKVDEGFEKARQERK